MPTLPTEAKNVSKSRLLCPITRCNAMADQTAHNTSEPRPLKTMQQSLLPEHDRYHASMIKAAVLHHNPGQKF